MMRAIVDGLKKFGCILATTVGVERFPPLQPPTPVLGRISELGAGWGWSTHHSHPPTLRRLDFTISGRYYPDPKILEI